MHRRELLVACSALLPGCLGGAGGGTPTRTPRETDTRSTAPRRSPDRTAERTDATRTGTGTPPAPRVRWAFEWNPSTETVNVAHDGGDVLTAANTARLEITVVTHPDHPIPDDATLTPTRTPTVTRRTWREAGGEYPVRQGDAVAVEATPGDTASVRWFRTHESDGEVLESRTLPKVER